MDNIFIFVILVLFFYRIIVVIFIINIKAQIHQLLCVGIAVFHLSAIHQCQYLLAVHTCISYKAEACLIGISRFHSVYLIRNGGVGKEFVSVIPAVNIPLLVIYYSKDISDNDAVPEIASRRHCYTIASGWQVISHIVLLCVAAIANCSISSAVV